MNKILLFLLITHLSFAQTNEVNTTENDPSVFLPELFKEFPNVRDITISNNGNEMYFTVESFKKEFSFIAVSKKINGKWNKPKVASFSGKDKDLEPFLAPNGLKLFFASNRSVDSNNSKKNMDIWFVERASLKSVWSKPKNIGSPINTDKDEFYPSVTNSGNLYFTAEKEDGKGKEDIYLSEYINGKYTSPKPLSEMINSKTYEFNAFVSPDENMIVFSSYRRPDSKGGTDLYISFKDKDGKWGKAKNMGSKINSSSIDYCPFVDFNTNTFYYTSEKSQMQSSFSEQKNANDIINKMNTFPNGLSRIFKIDNFQELFE